MDTVTATFLIPDVIDRGLNNGNYVRLGGVIRDAQTKQVVAMLREVAPNLTQDEYSDRIDKENLLKRVLKIEAMIETYRSFEVYKLEVEAIAQLGISFHDWLRLTPLETKPDGAELMYIIPSKPLDLVIS